jgi:DNA-binding CsgD family transcriptional regulator
VGDLERAASVALEGAERLDRAGYEEGANLLRSSAALPQMTSGRWAEAEALARAVLASGAGNQATWQARLVIGTVALRRGDFADARRHLDEARRLWSGTYGAMVGAFLAELALVEGRVEEARTLVAHSLELLGDTEAHDFVRLLASLGLRAEADGIRGVHRRSASTVGQAWGRADLLIARARAATLQGADLGAPATTEGEALRILCEAEFARVRGEHDANRWADVAEEWGASHPYEVAYAKWRRAEAHLAMGEKDEAVAVLRQSFSLACSLGAAPLRAEIETLARRARVRLGTTTQPDLAGAALDSRLSLTPRETEVLVLVAAGHTNQQIAEALFMSDKTASVHVSRILTKLGVANRAQAAAVAHRLQLF